MSLRKKPGQVPKILKYKNERLNIAKKILSILNITNTENTIIVKNITEETQKEIFTLEDEIKMFFNVGHWPYFKKITSPDKNFISLTKRVMKDTCIPMEKSVKYIDGKQLTCYTFDIRYLEL